MIDTIYALSSGSPPAAIAVIRISGAKAGTALQSLAGALPKPRQTSLRWLRDRDARVLDRALVLWLPGPETVTGEDIAELHVHGGRAVIDAVLSALGKIANLRQAEAGEFTRRAFANGRMDLAEAEGLADLLSAETELQRRSALSLASGELSERVGVWREEILRLSAMVEASLDFADDDDVPDLPDTFYDELFQLTTNLTEWLDRPRMERLRDGFRVVLGGPPNAGKSTLFNALVNDTAAIVSEIAGTTRDVLERSVALDGIAYTFVDTAGLRKNAAGAIEAMGIDRAKAQFEQADLILWLGPEGDGPDGAIEVDAKSDLNEEGDGTLRKTVQAIRVSARTGQGMTPLRTILGDKAKQHLPKPGAAALNKRQHGLITEARDEIVMTDAQQDLLLMGENLRRARSAFDRLIGRTSTDDMLDSLFGRFCIGK